MQRKHFAENKKSHVLMIFFKKAIKVFKEF